MARTLALGFNDPDLGFEAADEAMVRAYRNWSAVSQRRLSSAALSVSFSEGAIQIIRAMGFRVSSIPDSVEKPPS